MNQMSDIRRNALALALVLTAANLATSFGLVYETHKLRREAAQCVSELHGAMLQPVPVTLPPKAGGV